MSTEIRIGKSQVTDTFGKDAVVRLQNGENIYTLRGDKSFMTDYTWIVSNKINQLGAMLNINTVIILTDTVNEYYDYPNGLYSKSDLIISLDRANSNPGWVLTVIEKLVLSTNPRGICYILLDCVDKNKFNKLLRQLDENILKPYKNKLVVNYVVDESYDLEDATSNDIIEVTKLPNNIRLDDLAIFTELEILDYINIIQKDTINEIVVLHKGHAIKVKPYIN